MIAISHVLRYFPPKIKYVCVYPLNIDMSGMINGSIDVDVLQSGNNVKRECRLLFHGRLFILHCRLAYCFLKGCEKKKILTVA